MVLQRGQKVPIWGSGAPYDTVEIQFQGKTFKSKGKGDKSGKWMVWLDDLKAGGPYDLTITGVNGDGEGPRKKRNTITLNNVYVGEVWVCSGQSNMEMGLYGVENAQQVIAKSKNSKIRLFTVPKNAAVKPEHEIQGQWQECGPGTVGGFSAVAYFFGRDLQKALGVPIGLIHSSWGGTVAEAWTNKSALKAVPTLKYLADQADRDFASYNKAMDHYLDGLEKYLPVARKARAMHKDLPTPPFPPQKNPNWPTALYNGMIAPLIPYGIRGVIWYRVNPMPAGLMSIAPCSRP
jgi:sialate O-acetylesterase